MTWNYRVIRHRDEGGEEWFALHEVFYDEAGNPDSCTLEPIDFVCDIEEGPEEIAGSLEMALSDAKKHPVLDIAIFETDSQQVELERTQLELIHTLRSEVMQMTKEQLAELKDMIAALKSSGDRAIEAIDKGIASADEASDAIHEAKPDWNSFFDQPGVDVSDRSALEGFVLVSQSEYDELKSLAARGRHAEN